MSSATRAAARTAPTPATTSATAPVPAGTAPVEPHEAPAAPRPRAATPAASFYDDGMAHAAALVPADDDFLLLWHHLRDAATGGKGTRPRLLALTYRALGGTDHALAAHVGDAIELLHTAFLVHDDVIDHDTTRRGRPNVSGAFAARTLDAGAGPHEAATMGNAAGILAGDLALVGAIAAVARTPSPPHVVAALLDLVESAVRVTAAGELADVRLSLGTGYPDLGEVLTMEERKTAVYSFVLPMQAAAILVGTRSSLATLTALELMGHHLGAAFQLQDDLIGTFGDPARTGKSALSDLREGKCTPLVAHARTTAAWPVVAAHLGDPALTEAGADTVRAALEAHGSRAFVESLVRDHLSAARALARAAGLPADLADLLGTDWPVPETMARAA